MDKKEIFRSIVSRDIANLVIPNGVTSIGKYAFSECTKLTSITIPNSVTSIGQSAFTSCSLLTSITIPSSVSNIEGSVFYSSSSLPLKTIRFEQPSGMDITLGTSIFDCKTASNLTIYTDNEIIKNYDYASDNVTPTFYHLDGTAWI